MSEKNVSPNKRPIFKTILTIAAVIVLVVGIMALQSYHRAWGKMLRIDCQSNLRELGVRCLDYAAQHNGHFPSSWVDLNFTGADANGAKTLRCPQTDHEIGAWTNVDLWSDYRLLCCRTTNDPPNTILALEPLANHGGAGANVLFVDGSAVWLDQSNLLGSTNQPSAGTNSIR